MPSVLLQKVLLLEVISDTAASYGIPILRLEIDKAYLNRHNHAHSAQSRDGVSCLNSTRKLCRNLLCSECLQIRAPEPGQCSLEFGSFCKTGRDNHEPMPFTLYVHGTGHVERRHRHGRFEACSLNKTVHLLCARLTRGA